MRLIFVPQYPTPMRYQEWWFSEFPKQFKKYFDEVIVLGSDYIKKVEICRSEIKMFSPIHQVIEFENQQINEFLNLKLKEDDILFLADLSFPGLFSNVLYHKKIKAFAFVHGTSKNNFDYFSNNRQSKWNVESGHSKLFEKIFVGSQYHKDKLGWNNIIITRLPFPVTINKKDDLKVNNIISVSRPSIQKCNLEIEKYVIKKFGKIKRKTVYNWNDYCSLLSSSKILLSTAKEETFGYQIIDALMCGCIPLAPNKLSYPEILPSSNLYNNINELLDKIFYILNRKVEIPEILCKKEMDNFYETISNIMKGA